MKYVDTDADGCLISECIIMQSGGGFYVGRVYLDEKIGFPCPYERLSEYGSKEQMEKLLPAFLKDVWDEPVLVREEYK